MGKAEVSSGSLFIADWRPFIGWGQHGAGGAVCGWAAAVAGHPVLKLDDMLWELILTLLGVAGLRTVEKMRGAAR